MNHADATSTIAHKIIRLQQGRAEVMASAATSTGATDLSDIARRVSYIDGRIEGLLTALEVLLGVETVTASHLADLTV